MRVTQSHFVHITTFTPEGPELGVGFPHPEPLSRNPQIATIPKIPNYSDPWNNGPKAQPYEYKYKNFDGRQQPMFKRV
jgi:hypothetical protein